MHVPLWYFPLQTRLYRLQEAIYSAIIQELAILYIACSDMYIHSKNGSVQVVSFPMPFLPFWPYSCPDITQHRTNNDRRWQTLLCTFWKKFHRKADHLPEPFLECMYMSEQAIHRMAHSCMIALYIASWRRYRRVCSHGGKYHSGTCI